MSDKKPSWFARLKAGLTRSSDKLGDNLSGLSGLPGAPRLSGRASETEEGPSQGTLFR